MGLDSSSKQSALLRLVRLRQSTRPVGHFCLSDFHDGFYECDFVSPWTKSASNLNAEVMLVAQDWASAEFLQREKNHRIAELGQDETLATNRNLSSLLTRHIGINFSDTYATNLFPFVKPGPMNAPIKPRSLLYACARDYLLPQIEIVRPKMVVCIGSLAFGCLRTVLKLPPLSGVDATAEPSAHTRYGGVEIYGVAHTGQLGSNIRERSGAGAVDRDWAGLSARLKAI